MGQTRLQLHAKVHSKFYATKRKICRSADRRQAMNEMNKEDLKKAYRSEKDPKMRARILAVHMMSVCEESIGKTATNLMQS